MKHIKLFEELSKERQDSLNNLAKIGGVTTRGSYKYGKEVFPKSGKAYHLTPDIYIDEIKKVGLKIKSENKIENHPERIYLFLNPESGWKDLGGQLWNSSRYKEKIKDYYVLEIDLSKLPDNKYFADPESFLTFSLGIYTEQSIPPSAIKVKEKIPVGSLGKKREGDTRKAYNVQTYK